MLIVLAAANFLISVPVAIYSQLHCSPHNAIWDPLRQAQCNTHAYVLLSYVIGALAAVSDLTLALLPIYILWSLQIDRRLKVGLCVLLGVGFIAAIAAIVRTWASGFLAGVDASCRSSPIHPTNWENVECWLTCLDKDHLGTLFTWGEVEEWLVIIAMSIPPTWPLFKSGYERFARTGSYLSGEKYDCNQRSGVGHGRALRIRQDREFELTSESLPSIDTKRHDTQKIEEDEERFMTGR